MLDQNTDRMWFVIGAVIVGAAIIALANLMFPNLFDSIMASFENAIPSEEIESIVPNDNPTPDVPGIITGFSI